MELLMIGHLLGDFYFQPDSMAEEKKKSFWITLLHCFIYSVIMYIVLALMTGQLFSYISLALLVGVLHLGVDSIKYIIHKVGKLEKYQLVVFIFDQIIHIVLLMIVAYMYTIKIDISWIPEIPEYIVNGIGGYLVVACAFLFCGKPAAVIVSLVFSMIPHTIQNSQGDEKEENEKQEEIKIGSWIGILEREIMLILGLLGEYGAIGFVIAAKSLARHNQFNIPAFAEKYLIGTLVSSLIALICIIVCSVI